jgi:hypothetical protein
MRSHPTQEYETKNRLWQPGTIFLSGGTDDPRVTTFDIDSNETRRLLELPPSGSAYSIDMDPEGNLLAVGTRGGWVYVLGSDQGESPDESIVKQRLVQGASVLSICWVNQSTIAVSDTAGRCLLWQANRDEPPKVLADIEGVICSLLTLADGVLVGLTSTGKLYFWEPFEGELIQTVDVPYPPPISGLLRMVYWTAGNSLVFPGAGGNLTFFDIEKQCVRSIDAHKGDFYAISLWNDELLTVGMEDCRIKIWRPGSSQSSISIHVPETVICSCVADSRSAQLLLVGKNGTADLYSLKGDELRLVTRVSGKGYRIAVVPGSEKMQALFVQQDTAEIERIICEIQESLGRVPADTIDKLHERLIELHYEHVSLAIRAEQADKNGDIVKGIQFSYSLLRIVPKDNPNICISMEKYAGLLEKACHIEEADAVCSHILNIDPNYAFILETDKLAHLSKLVRDENCVIEPDIPINQIIESATAIGKQFVGRFVIKELKPEENDRVRLNPELIAKKYEEIRLESNREALPSASTERVWWLSREKADAAFLVTFGDGHSNEIKRLQFALKVFNGSHGTVAVPVILFDCRNVETSESFVKENEKIAKWFNYIKNKDFSTPFLSDVHKTLRLTLRRLVTENLSERRFNDEPNV